MTELIRFVDCDDAPNPIKFKKNRHYEADCVASITMQSSQRNPRGTKEWGRESWSIR